MKTGKLLKLTYWLFGSFVALLIVASVAIGFIDWNQYRGTLADLASSRLGMRVELAGRVGVGLFPRPEVSAETVRLYPAGDPAAAFVATADRIDMRLGFSALLKGDVAVQHLGFDGLDVVVEEDSEGTWKVRGWPEAEGESATASVQMERLQIVGGTIQLVDRTGASQTVEGLSFGLKGQLPLGPLKWDGSFVAAGQKVTSTGRLRPSNDDSVLSMKTDIGLSGGNLHVSGRVFDDGFAGRIQTEGDNLASFLAATQAVLGNKAAPLSVPEQKFELDVQVDREAGVYRAISRTLDVGGTRGRLDLTVARRNSAFHAAGSVSLGIVDLAPWLDAQSGTEGAVADGVPGPTSVSRLTGAIDLAVEGVEIGGGVVQQMDAVVRFTESGMQLTNLQALLPGGSGFIFSGTLMAGKGYGTVQMVSGNLPDLLRWMQIDVAGRIPPGRLATGEVSADLNVGPDTWRLSGLEARVDTSNFSGEVIGRSDSIWPDRLTLTADALNLDAYLSDASSSGESGNLFEAMPPKPIAVEFTAGEVLWGGARYVDLGVTGALGREEIRLAALSVQHAGGKLDMTGRLRALDKSMEAEGEATLAKWTFPAVRALSADAAGYLRALGIKSATGTVSVAGPQDAMRVSVKLSEDRSRSLSLNGGVGYGRDAIKIDGVQGTLAHEDLGRLAAMFGYTLVGKVPADLTFAVGDNAAGARNITLSGGFAGGQLLAEGNQQGQRQEWRMNYDHKRAADVLALLDMEGQLPHPEEALRGRARVGVSANGWEAQDIDVRNGPARFAGNISRAADNKISGRLAATGFTYNPPLGQKGATAPAPSRAVLDPALFDLAGRVEIALDQVEVLGQKIAAPNARLIAGDRIFRFSLGDGALINGAASDISLSLTRGESLALDGKATITNVDIGAMLRAEGLANAVQGAGSLDVAFEGQGNQLDGLLRGLKARGTIKGQAGSLNFLSVPTLVREMGSAPSATMFLGSVGRWLREGNTAFGTLDARFTLDAGTMLLEEFVAAGGWGQLGLDGQINFRDAFLNLKGALSLTTPPDTPAIPVEYTGPLSNPSASWASRALERFVIAGIERRLRSNLSKDLEKIQGDQTAATPGTEVFSRAFDLLGRLKAKQEAKKEQKNEAASEPSQETEEQRP